MHIKSHLSTTERIQYKNQLYIYTTVPQTALVLGFKIVNGSINPHTLNLTRPEHCWSPYPALKPLFAVRWVGNLRQGCVAPQRDTYTRTCRTTPIDSTIGLFFHRNAYNS
jgi:hypothetical protein